MNKLLLHNIIWFIFDLGGFILVLLGIGACFQIAFTGNDPLSLIALLGIPTILYIGCKAYTKFQKALQAWIFK